MRLAAFDAREFADRMMECAMEEDNIFRWLILFAIIIVLFFGILNRERRIHHLGEQSNKIQRATPTDGGEGRKD